MPETSEDAGSESEFDATAPHATPSQVRSSLALPVNRRRLAVGATAFLAIAASGVGTWAVFGNRSAHPSGSSVVSRARGFVRQSRSVEYRTTLRVTQVSDRGHSGGSESPIVATSTDTARFPDRGRSLASESGQATELIYIGNRVYLRQSDTSLGLQTQPFGVRNTEDLTSRKSPGVNQRPLFARPEDLAADLGAFQSPTIVHASGARTTIHAGLDPGRAIGLGVGTIARTSVTLTVDGRGRIEGLSVAIQQRNVLLEFAFSDFQWNRSVTIDTPTPEHLDLAGYIDRQGLSRFGTKLFQPKTIPQGWTLQSAAIVPGVPGNTTCDTVQVHYAGATLAEYLLLYEVPERCARGTPPGSEAFHAGPYDGIIGSDPSSGATGARLYAGKTTIVAYTTLSRTDLAAALTALAPLDLAQRPQPKSPAPPPN